MRATIAIVSLVAIASSRASAQPVIGPGEDLAPLDPSLPLPISNPRVASNGGKALVVWVDAPYVVTPEPATSAVGAFVNVYRQQAPRLKGRLLDTLGDVKDAPVLDFGEGPTPAPEDFPDRYDNSFRALPLGEGFVVIGYHERPTRRLLARLVSAAGVVSESRTVDPSSVSESGAPFSLSLAHDGWDAVVHDGGIAVVGKRGAGLGVLQVSAGFVPISGRTLREVPRFDRVWTGASEEGRGAVLLERGLPTTAADPDRTLVVVRLGAESEVVSIPRPAGRESVYRTQRPSGLYCAYCGGEAKAGIRPPSLAAAAGALVLDDADRIIRLVGTDVSSDGDGSSGLEPQEFFPLQRPGSAPVASLLCSHDGAIGRYFQNEMGTSVGGVRGTSFRRIGDDPFSPVGTPRRLLHLGRVGGSPCGVAGAVPFIVDRALVVHALADGVGRHSTAMTPMEVAPLFAFPSTVTQSGGRHGILVGVARLGLNSTAPDVRSVRRKDLLGRWLDDAPVPLVSSAARGFLGGVDSTEDTWFACTHAPGEGGRSVVRLHLLPTRGPALVKTVESGRVDIAQTFSCQVNVYGGAVHVMWRGADGGPSMLWHRAHRLDGQPVGSAAALANSSGSIPMTDAAMTVPQGALVALTGFTGGLVASGDEGALFFTDGTTIRLAREVQGIWVPVPRQDGWVGIRTLSANDSNLLVFASGPTGEVIDRSAVVPKAFFPYGGAAWDGVGFTVGDANGLNDAVPSPVDGVATARVEFAETGGGEHDGSVAGVAASYASATSTWGGVSFAMTGKRDGGFRIGEATIHSLHRAANVTAAHLELTVRNHAAHPITLGPPVHEGQPQRFNIHVAPLHGTAELHENVARYIPDGDYVGEDSFFFIVTGADDSKRAFTIVLHVEPGDPVTFAAGGCGCNGSTATLLSLLATVLRVRLVRRKGK